MLAINQPNVCSYAQECLYVLLHVFKCEIKVRFALWHMSSNLCQQVQSDLKAE